MSEPNNPADGREFERKNILFAANPIVGGNKIDCEIINIPSAAPRCGRPGPWRRRRK